MTKRERIVDSATSRAGLPAVKVDALRHALAVAAAFEQAADDVARLLRHAQNVAAVKVDAVNPDDGDLEHLRQRVATAANVAQWLAPVAEQARRVANRHAVAVLVELADQTDPTTGPGAAVRRVAAARYGVRIGPGGDVDAVDQLPTRTNRKP